jgi:hypothetical protein
MPVTGWVVLPPARQRLIATGTCARRSVEIAPLVAGQAPGGAIVSEYVGHPAVRPVKVGKVRRDDVVRVLDRAETTLAIRGYPNVNTYASAPGSRNVTTPWVAKDRG